MTQAKVANKNFKFSDSKKTEIVHQIFQLNMSHVMRKLLKPYGNNKDSDQPAHLRSLISIFVVHCLDSIIPIDSICKNSRLWLVSEAEQTGLSLTWSQTSEDRLSCDKAHM